MRYLACLLILAGCSGGGESPAPEQKPVFPALNQVRSDFISQTEGLASDPLKIAFPPCTILPPTDWQVWLCSMQASVPTVYAKTNAFSTATDNRFAWIISMNNEFIQDTACNTGPPNQSLGANEYPFSMTAGTSLKLEVSHDDREFCGKIPYMSATYIRGVQGDAVPRIYGWRELQGRTLDIDVDLYRALDELAWFRVLTHFRDPRTGQRYFVNKDYVMPDTIPDYWMNWNWPYENSFQYPGAKIAIPARIPSQSLKNGPHKISIDVAQQGVRYFPEFLSVEPDFLGVEIAVELGPIKNKTSVDIKSVTMK